MLLNTQRNLLTVLATLACAAALLVTGVAAREVRIKTAQISMAEETIRAVTNFRYLTMEFVLYGEARPAQQWTRRHASVQAALAQHQYSERAENLLLDRERANLAVLDRLFKRLLAAGAATPDAPQKQSNTIVSALFLTTQDMLDDGFDLMRLIRLDLERAQLRATISAIASLTLLVLLIGLTSMIMKRRVLQPVAKLQRLTEQVIMGNLDVRLNLPAPNEIGMLGRTFDAMTLQLQQSHEAMQRENAERRRAQANLEASVAELAAKSDELARAQTALQTFIDHTPALVMYWDSELRNRFANRAYLEWFGQSPQEIRGKHIAAVIGADRYAEIEARLRSVLAGHSEVFERRLTLPNGEVRDALFSYIPDIQERQVRGMYGFVSDITSLKRAEAGQQAALLQLQAVVNAASDFALVQTDLRGTIKLFSVGAERMLGYAAAEVVERHHPGIFHVAAELARHAAGMSARFGVPLVAFESLTTAALADGSASLDWTFVRKDGSTLPVNLTVTPVRDAQAQVIGFLGIAKDIRAERESRQVLADARDQAEQANLAKSQFLANMSHEIRTPMNAVLGMLELLQHTALSPLQADYARKSESAARSLLELLNDILDFSQVEANKLELECVPFRLDGLMRDLSVILSSLLGNKDVELIFAIDPAIPALLRGDATRLRQVLINLASNAIKFTERGEVTLTLRLKSSSAQGVEVEFIVQDSGIGIAPDKLETIFDGFTQAEASTSRRFGGTGLGLTISQRLVGLMQGRLEVTSTLGAGSRFAFAAVFGQPVDAEARADVDCVRVPMHVLIVDDNRFSRDSLMSMVTSFGWHGAAVAGGAEALALLQPDAAPALPFDVVLIDWRMPDMDGWELAHRIRKHSHVTPIIVMVTAHGRSALAERLQDERCLLNGFLTKPVTPAMLHDAICNAEAGRSIETVQTAQAQSMQRLAGLRLLAVDDNPMNQQIARELLVREGARVDVASGGALALAMAANTAYDAILMDIQMPDMDGYACTRALRATPANRSTPVIAMTANVMSSDRDACLAAGMNDHVGKPISIDVMVRALLRHCRDAPQEVPAAAPPRASAPVTPAGAAIDLDAALARLGGNADLYLALAKTYAGEAAQFMPALRAALALPDQLAAANILHTFKNAAGIVGACALQNCASDLEAALRDVDAKVDAKRALAQLETLVGASSVELAHCTRTLADAQVDVAPAAAPAAPLASLLHELAQQLGARNMAALGALTALEQAYGIALGAALAPLANSIEELDFATAERECRALLSGIE